MDALVGNPADGTFNGGQSTVGFYMEKQREVDLGLHTARATAAERNRQSMADMYMQAYSKDSSVLRLQSEALLLFKIKSSSRKGVRYNVCLTTMICDCSDNFNNAIICKHIFACRLYVHKFNPHLLANIAPPDARNPTILAASYSTQTDRVDEQRDSVAPPDSLDACHSMQKDLDDARLQVEAALHDVEWEGLTSFQANQTVSVMKSFVKQLQMVTSIEKPLTRDERVAQARLVRTIQQANTAARRPTSSAQDPDRQPTDINVTKQPGQQTKHRKKIKQTHKRIVLPGEHHSKFKRARCDNCETSNYVCVKGKATEASTTCINCDEEVTWVRSKRGHT
ncbi:Hypp9745 [Branchiostoma lanceolatum]|uniref:Hypp9745 protein n=1 Tax=Branchiostoma lanceolatum TaxID=7740 RepID=A0A8S4MPJ9_BRALA|nr:Hypp9745 [Branchiostoma lanceolatum]